MVSKSYKEFQASAKAAPGPTSRQVGPVPADERFEVSIYLKPRHGGASNSARSGSSADPRLELQAQRIAQHADDIKLVREFAQEQGLTVVSATGKMTMPASNAASIQPATPSSKIASM